MFVTGATINIGSVVTSVVNANTITISSAAANSSTNTSLTFYTPNKLLVSHVASPGVAKAWVNFNGTGTVAIRGAFNVSSITDNGTGDYTVRFTTAMPDENYSVCVGNGSFNDGVNDNNILLIGPRRGTVNPYTTSGARISTAFRAVGSTSQFDDPALATLAFFR
jgi:hypothetical protein